jgi:hypothetical protein
MGLINTNPEESGMFSGNRAQAAGLVGMASAVLFFVGLLIEYRYDLFPPGGGTLYLANQIMFFVAMTGLVMMLWGMRQSGAGGDGRLARLSLTLFPLGLAAIILGGIMGLFTQSQDSPLIPIGALIMVVFGLLSGIAVARAGRWQGWTRFAPLLQGVYYAILVASIALSGFDGPTQLTESLWMVTWFLTSLALYVNAAPAVAAEPA